MARATYFLYFLLSLSLPALALADSYDKGGSHHAGQLSWGYRSQGDTYTVPEQWKSLAPLCAESGGQSPIDIRYSQKAARTDASLSAPTIQYQNAEMEVFHNRHTVQATAHGTENTLQFAGKKYTLRNIHYHRKSEHLLDGEQYDIEIHMVHEAEDGQLLVLGVLADITGDSSVYGEGLAGMLRSVRGRKDQYVPTPITLNPARFLPPSRDFATYAGSLTTPPCKETVRWIVFLSPQKLSVEVQRAFHEKKLDIGFLNFRPHFEVTEKHGLRFSKD